MLLAGRVSIKRGCRYWTGDGADQADTLNIGHGRGSESLAESCQHRHRLGGSSVVVAFERVEAVSIGADNGDSWIVFLQWQKVILILEKYEGFAGSLQRELTVSLVVILSRSNSRIRHHVRRIEHA